MPADPGNTDRNGTGWRPPGERWLAIGAAAGFALLLIASGILSLRYGEIVYFARVIAPLPGCL